MISDRDLRRIASQRKLPLDLIEKDYALGWILVGVFKSSMADSLVFKGGTALSKLYFPLNWRISEDLDFTSKKKAPFEEIPRILMDELPEIVRQESRGLILDFKRNPFVNPGYLQMRIQFTGPIWKNTIKVEVTKENFIGDFEGMNLPPVYDYPEHNTTTYTLNNILAEKLRSMIERKKIRDYYDSWKLLKLDKVMNIIDNERVKALFIKKCHGKGITFHGIEQFFPENIIDTFNPHLPYLTRMTSETLPTLETLIEELRLNMKRRLGL